MKINEACQKTHRLAIEIFLIMTVIFVLTIKLTTPLYEVVPKEKAFFLSIDGVDQELHLGYVNQTSYELISEEKANVLHERNKAFQNRINVFGITIFLLYAITQFSRWKKKVLLITRQSKNN